MNSTKNKSFETAAKKVFNDLYALIKEEDKPFKFDLSIMPADIISCIGNHLEDYPFNINDDTDFYKLFFKHDKPDDYKEYIKYSSDIKNHRTNKEYNFTESCKTDIYSLLLNVKKYFKEFKIKTHEIKFNHQIINEIGFIKDIKIFPMIYFMIKMILVVCICVYG